MRYVNACVYVRVCVCASIVARGKAHEGLKNEVWDCMCLRVFVCVCMWVLLQRQMSRSERAHEVHECTCLYVCACVFICMRVCVFASAVVWEKDQDGLKNEVCEYMRLCVFVCLCACASAASDKEEREGLTHEVCASMSLRVCLCVCVRLCGGG